MNTIVEKITEQLQNAFAECGYDRKYAKVSLSNRPDLCLSLIHISEPTRRS